MVLFLPSDMISTGKEQKLKEHHPTIPKNKCIGEKESSPPPPFTNKCLNIVPTLLLEGQGQAGR